MIISDLNHLEVVAETDENIVGGLSYSTLVSNINVINVTQSSTSYAQNESIGSGSAFASSYNSISAYVQLIWKTEHLQQNTFEHTIYLGEFQ